MIFRPHAYQQHCINRILEVKKIGLFLDMGLGKTVTTLTAVKELKYNRFLVRRVLVIAPKKVAEGTWTREAAKWDPVCCGYPRYWGARQKGSGR